MINFDTRSTALGDDSLTELGFDFLITKKADILISIIEDGEDDIIVDGDDTTYIEDVDFDPVSGGGTVTLVNALATGQTLYLDLNVAEPDQQSKFRDLRTYSLRAVENTFDYITTAIQTLYRNSERSLKFKRHVDISAFDPTVPEDFVGTPNVTFVTNDDGTAIIVGPTTDEIANAQAYSLAAQLAETNAEAAEVAAELAQTAAEAAQAAAEAAAAASLTAKTMVGDSNTPELITAGGGITFASTAWVTQIYLQGDSGPIDITYNPQIQYGSVDGQELILVGTDDTNYVDLEHGDGLNTGDQTIRLGNKSIARFVWDDSEGQWLLLSTNGIIP